MTTEKLKEYFEIEKDIIRNCLENESTDVSVTYLSGKLEGIQFAEEKVKKAFKDLKNKIILEEEYLGYEFIDLIDEVTGWD